MAHINTFLLNLICNSYIDKYVHNKDLLVVSLNRVSILTNIQLTNNNRPKVSELNIKIRKLMFCNTDSICLQYNNQC